MIGRLLLIGYLIINCLYPCYPSPSPIPSVPSSIEIAGVKLKISSDAREEIQKDVNALRASDKYFKVKLDRVNLYFPIIERVLKEEGVPDDLKYLSIQESALVSDAVSSADAVGYWQFKDFTAREVGLRVDNKVDERKNIVSATRGAAKYFKRNNFYFKNWIYSVSAYQAGPGGAKKYVDKDNFGSDKLTITKNTHWYVLRFIAHVIAFKDEVGATHSEGLKLLEYTKGAGKSLDQIARQYDADVQLVEEYNKWLRHGKVPDDKEYAVIIPVQGKIPKELKEATEPPPLSRNIKEAEPIRYPEHLTGEPVAKQTLTVKINGLEALMATENDNVVNLALKAGISSNQLVKYNDLQGKERIVAGEIYYTEKKKNRSAIHFHVAKEGESLWSISQKYGIKLKKLAKKNRMEEDDMVKPGRLMWMRKKRPKNTPVEYHEVKKPEPVIVKTKTPDPPVIKKEEPVNRPEPFKEPVNKDPEEKKSEVKKIVQPPGTERVIHIVQPGESLWALAQSSGVTTQDIIDWNQLGSDNISPGDELTLYLKERKGNSEPGEERKENVSIHEVSEGETLWAISRKYEVSLDSLMLWNGLKNSDPINPGQKLYILPPQELPTPKSSNATSYAVKQGDSLYSIAKEFNTTVEKLMEMNNLKSPDLSIGQELKIK